jgi:hypothetical protein
MSAPNQLTAGHRSPESKELVRRHLMATRLVGSVIIGVLRAESLARDIECGIIRPGRGHTFFGLNNTYMVHAPWSPSSA